MNNLGAAITFLGIAYYVYKIFELYARRKERMFMIEKMSFGESMATPPDLTKWFSPLKPKCGALRFGLLLVGIGLGLGIALMMNFCMGPFPKMADYQSSRHWDSLYVALMMLFGGLGLLISYLIEQKNQKKT